MVFYIFFGILILVSLVAQFLCNSFLLPRLLEKYSLEEFLALYKDRSSFNRTHLISNRAISKLLKG